MMYPKVLVFSEGICSAKEIAENIIRAKDEKIVHYNMKNMSGNCVGYLCNLKTKYYENCIVLVPIDMEIEKVSSTLEEQVEAVIVYSDSTNKNFIQRTPLYTEYIKNHNVENGLVIFENLCNDSADGITYKDLQLASNFVLDIIELNNVPDQQDEDSKNNLGYYEVLETLYSFMWSNIDIKQVTTDSATSTHESETAQNTVEAELDVFENLCMKIQSFKSVSSSMEREDVLNRAEKLATQFVQLMNSDVDDDL